MTCAAAGSPGIQIQGGLPGFRVATPARRDGGMPTHDPIILGVSQE